MKFSKFFVALIVSLLAMFSHAETFFVDEVNGSDENDGLSPTSPLKLLRTAAGKTSPGDTVKILPGIYRDMGSTNAFDGLYIPNSGRPGEYITFSGVADNNGNLPIIESAALTAFTLQTKSYVIVENLEFRGSEDDFLNTAGTLGDWAWQSRSGIGVQSSSHNIIIRNCYLHDFPGGGIGVSDSDVVLVENNVVEHTSWGSSFGNSGISFYKMTEQPNAVRFSEYPDHDVIIKNNVSRYNVNLRGTAAFEWALTDGNGIIVDDFKHTQGDELDAFEGSSLIVGNVAYGNGATGINVFQTNDVDVLYNTIFDNGQSRRAENQPSDLVFNQSHQPIQVGGSANTYVANNIFVRSDERTSMISYFWNDEETVSIENNIFWNTVGEVGETPPGNIVANPEFIDAAHLKQSQTNLLATLGNVYVLQGSSGEVREPTKNNNFPIHDFALRSTSPAIDEGIFSPYYEFSGNFSDIGAVEFDGSSEQVYDNKITQVETPTVFTPGETAEISIDYSASETRDLLIMLEDANNGYRWEAFKRVTVQTGVGSVDINLKVNANAPEHGNYKFQILLTSVDGFHAETLDTYATNGNIVSSGGMVEEPVVPEGAATDELINVNVQGSFVAGSTTVIAVEYKAKEPRDIMIALEDANNNYSWEAFSNTTVPAGENTVEIDLSVNADAPKHGNYKFQVILTSVSGYHSGELDSVSNSANSVE